VKGFTGISAAVEAVFEGACACTGTVTVAATNPMAPISAPMVNRMRMSASCKQLMTRLWQKDEQDANIPDEL
jgi:hypothetical protein